MFIRFITLLVSISALGCANQLDYEMGSSVAMMESEQVYDTANAANPPEGVVNGYDGGAAEKAIDSYRGIESESQKTEAVEKDVEFKM